MLSCCKCPILPLSLESHWPLPPSTMSCVHVLAAWFPHTQVSAPQKPTDAIMLDWGIWVGIWLSVAHLSTILPSWPAPWVFLRKSLWRSSDPYNMHSPLHPLQLCAVQVPLLERAGAWEVQKRSGSISEHMEQKMLRRGSRVVSSPNSAGSGADKRPQDGWIWKEVREHSCPVLVPCWLFWLLPTPVSSTINRGSLCVQKMTFSQLGTPEIITNSVSPEPDITLTLQLSVCYLISLKLDSYSTLVVSQLLDMN